MARFAEISLVILNTFRMQPAEGLFPPFRRRILRVTILYSL